MRPTVMIDLDCGLEQCRGEVDGGEVVLIVGVGHADVRQRGGVHVGLDGAECHVTEMNKAVGIWRKDLHLQKEEEGEEW